jgi:hypothetical protein
MGRRRERNEVWLDKKNMKLKKNMAKAKQRKDIHLSDH